MNTIELESLKARIKDGNEKLNIAWQRICELDHTLPQWGEEIEKWHQANEKLSALCSELKVSGFEDCLYIEDGKKTRRCGFSELGCRVCPSRRAYWEEELYSEYAKPA